MENNYISIKLRRSDWDKVQNALNYSNYCIVKNANGKRSVTYSKFAKDKNGFYRNKKLSKKINDKLFK